ncbi:MAG: hypothetical protein WC208_15260 [Gallionella sp.]|jgi:hypothetical protein
MTACKLCNRDSGFFAQAKVYYSDPLCTVLYAENRLLCVYSYHRTPSYADYKWLETQVRVVGNRMWGKEWQLKDDFAGHPIMIGRPLNTKKYKAMTKYEDITNRTKKID